MVGTGVRQGTVFRTVILLLSVCVLVGFMPLHFMVSPNAGYKYQVTILALRKEDGTAATQFRRGEFVFVEVKLKNIMTYTSVPEPYLLVARATHELTLYGLGAFSGSMVAGQELNAMPAFMIPSNAPLGSYEVKVMVFNTWPMLGGYPIAASVTTTFTVIP